MVERKKYCVNGEWRESKTDKWMPVTDSSTGELLAEVPCCTVDEVESAIAAAEAAFPAWSQMSISKRTQMMFKWRDILVNHLDELTLLCSKELGKSLSEARGDVLKAIEPTELSCATPFISQGSASLQVTSGFDTAIYRVPLGVVAGNCALQFPRHDPLGVDGSSGYRNRQYRGAESCQPDPPDLHAHFGAVLYGGRFPQGCGESGHLQP